MGSSSNSVSLQNSVIWVLGTNCKFSVWLMKTGIITCRVKSERVKYVTEDFKQYPETPFSKDQCDLNSTEY